MNAPPALELDLLALPKAVPDLRRTVRRHLGVPCADVQLCVTELLANVVRHVGEGPRSAYGWHLRTAARPGSR